LSTIPKFALISCKKFFYGKTKKLLHASVYSLVKEQKKFIVYSSLFIAKMLRTTNS